jgi:glycosyltransferase involved in cell wall biosynthesis
MKMGFEVWVVGCRCKQSPSLSKPFHTKRFRMLFKKRFPFFAEFNIRLFFHLLFNSYDILVANDLETLLPVFLMSRLKKKPIVYDSHEYFCEMITVIHKPLVRKIWLAVERFCFPKLKHVITVSPSIAKAYQKQYGVDVQVVRNIPSKEKPAVTQTRKSLGLPEDKTIVILQGNHIARDRGAEELLESMPFTSKEAFLLIVGSGEVIETLKQKTQTLHLENRVRFVDRVPPETLFNYTCLADIGISFDKNVSKDHYFSLPNKIFEYIQAETPLLISNLPERSYIVSTCRVGLIVEELTPQSIAEAINLLIEDQSLYNKLKANCKEAAKTLNWENEEKVLQKIYSGL